MSRTVGLFVALLVGGAAAFLHAFALKKAQSELQVPMTRYAKVTKAYGVGERLSFTKKTAPKFFNFVEVPTSANLKAVKLSELDGIVDMRVSRSLSAGELLLWQDLAPPDPTLNLKENERALLVSVKNIAVEPKLLRVGQEVGFVIESTRPAPANSKGGETPRERMREVGPFRIVSIGDQVADDVQGSSLTISVAVTIDSGGRLAEEGALLLDAEEERRLRAMTLYGKAAGESTGGGS